MMLTKEEAIRRIKSTGKITEARAEACSFYVAEGAYLDTSDDVAGTWYVGRDGDHLDKRGVGHRSKKEAMEAIREIIVGD